MKEPTDQKSVLELVMFELANSLGRPSDEFPSVRCVTRPSLVRLVGRIQKKLDDAMPSGLTALAVIHLLQRSRILAVIELDDCANDVAADRFLAFGWGVEPTELSPLELLQADQPSGVICYFSALMVHKLTTQPTVHHHISTARKRSVSKPDPSSLRAVTAKAAPLGSWRFTYRGARFFRTTRDPQYLVAFQRVDISDKSWCRVTTLEQTLLDTLHRPMSCGGPAVVFESWRNASERMQPLRLAALLEQISDETLRRRVGYMMDQVDLPGYVIPRAEGKGDGVPVSLLNGIPYTRIDPRWNLLVP